MSKMQGLAVCSNGVAVDNKSNAKKEVQVFHPRTLKLPMMIILIQIILWMWVFAVVGVEK